MRPLASLVSALCAVSSLTLLNVDSLAAARRDWPSQRYAAELSRYRALNRADRARAQSFLDSLLQAAHLQHNTGLEMVMSVEHAAQHAWLDFALDEARDETQRWLPSVSTSGDTLCWCTALRTIGFAELMSSRPVQAAPPYREMLALANRAQLTTMQGYANLGVSYLAIQSGDLHAAERGYRTALTQLTRPEDGVPNRTARAGLANALVTQGRSDEARREYERVLAESRAAGDRRNEMDALNDLGLLEMSYGDPSRAIPYFRESAAGQRAAHREVYALTALGNVGAAMTGVGLYDQAAAIFDSIANAARATDAPDLAASALAELGNIRRIQGRLGEARAALERAVALRDSCSVGHWAQAVVGLVRVEALAGAPARARQLAADALSSGGDRLAPPERANLLLEL
ncbi:MAG: tetratricopeptide repeat protein, partial [Candidatus Eiseniibacteriota bacterium]